MQNPDLWIARLPFDRMGRYPRQLLRIPSIALPYHTESLTVLARVTGGVLAPWPFPPLFREDGKADVEGRNGFSDWLKPNARQEFRARWQHNSSSWYGNVGFFIDAHMATEETLLPDPQSHPFSVLCDISSYLTHWMWLAVPIGNEFDRLLFCCREERKDWVPTLQDIFSKLKSPTWNLEENRDGLYLINQSGFQSSVD